MRLLKKITILFSLIILSENLVHAQVSTYSFTQAAGGPTALTPAYTTHATGTNDDGTFAAVPIGFTFFFDCAAYTTVSISNNGYIVMGNTVANSYTPLSGGANNNVISVMGEDLQGLATGSLRSKLTGVSPNRQFTIEWQHYETWGGADDYSFSIVLNETTNSIEFHYSSATTIAGNWFEVGLRGASAADFNNRTKVNATNWTASGAGATIFDIMSTGGNAARNPNGIFTWTPTAGFCAGAPTGGTASATPNSLTTCAAITSVLSLAGSSTGCGISYQWQSAPAAGGPWTNIAGATTAPYTVTPPAGTTFYRCVVTCSSSGLSTNSSTTSVSNTAPVVPNNECATATNVPINSGASCASFVSGTVACASASADANACFGTADDDVWYSFVATGTNLSISLFNVAGSTTDLYHSVYSGTCGSLTNLSCSDPNSSNISGLTVGVTYYLRVYTWTSTAGQTTTFDVCLQDPCPGGAPVNDECATATSVAVNAGSACTLQTPGTISCATASPQANTCFGTDDDDVWFSFVATGPTEVINLNNVVGSVTDMYHAVYSGTCGSLTNLICSDANTSTLTGLTAGTTYYIRVYTYTATAGQIVSFDVCVSNPCPGGAPANDECVNAIAVPVNPTITCASTVAGSISCATPSAQANPCGAAMDDDDVWFSFVATATAITINLNSVTGSTTDLYHSVYSGTCGSLTNISCSDPNTSYLTGLTVGTTYYLRVYTWTSTANQLVDFVVCLTQTCPGGAPVNDECVNATPLTVSVGGCTTTAGTISCATASAQANTCGAAMDDDDVWYSFVATSTSHGISISNVVGSTTDLYHSVFSGTCGSLTNILCSDPNTSTLTGLTIGTTYYVRVYTWTSTAGQVANFDICINTMGPCGNPTTNDYCSDPAILTYNPASSFASSTAATYTADSPANVGTVFCGSIENNSWYQFTATATTHTFFFSSVTGCTGGIQAHVYDVTVDASGCCTGFTSVSNCLYPGSATPGTVTATPLTIGNTYILMIDGNAGANCDYTVDDWGAVGVLAVDLLSFNASRINNDNYVIWKTASEVDNNYFVVERSFDGEHFMVVGQVSGQGNSNTLKEYSFTDKEVNSPLMYYRLRQVDYDGTSTITKPIVLKNSTASFLEIYPNPADNVLNFRYISTGNEILTITYTDMAGRAFAENVSVVKGENNFLSTQFGALAKGVYIVSIKDESNQLIKTHKLIKQ